MSSKTWVAHSQFDAIFYRQMSLLPKQHTCAVRSKRIRTDRVCRGSAAGLLSGLKAQNVDPEVQLGSVWGSPDREDLRSLYQRSRHRGVLRRAGLSFLFQTVFPKTSLTSSGSGMFTPFVSELWSKRVISMVFFRGICRFRQVTRSGEILTKLDQNSAELGHQGQHVRLWLWITSLTQDFFHWFFAA